MGIAPESQSCWRHVIGVAVLYNVQAKTGAVESRLGEPGRHIGLDGNGVHRAGDPLAHSCQALKGAAGVVWAPALISDWHIGKNSAEGDGAGINPGAVGGQRFG